jgi:hypothetical protein
LRFAFFGDISQAPPERGADYAAHDCPNRARTDRGRPWAACVRRICGWKCRAGSDVMGNQRFGRFADCYPFYLGEHTNPVCRGLHFAGSTLGALLLAAALITQRWWLIAVALACGYAFAWVGHFFFEHNRPATF